MRTWSRCDSLMPANEDLVLVYGPTCDHIGMGYWDFGDETWRTEDGYRIDPTHWMPLPDPPDGVCDICAADGVSFLNGMVVCRDCAGSIADRELEVSP